MGVKNNASVLFFSLLNAFQLANSGFYKDPCGRYALQYWSSYERNLVMRICLHQRLTTCY